MKLFNTTTVNFGWPDRLLILLGRPCVVHVVISGDVEHTKWGDDLINEKSESTAHVPGFPFFQKKPAQLMRQGEGHQMGIEIIEQAHGESEKES